MKRSYCLSALLVGLSLTTATAALAAPPAASPDQKKVQQVAQAQDPSSSGTSNATAAPTSPSESPTQPAVTVGTSPGTPGTDTPAEAAPEPAKKPAPRPFAGSALFLQNSMTTNTVLQGQTQYSNPTVESSLFILPRYAINDAFQLRARMIMSYEYTDSDSTTYNREPSLSDTTVQLFYRKIPKLPLGIQPNIALNVGLPTSKLSRARTLMFSPGATLQLSRPFEKILGADDGLILANLTYAHPMYTSRNPEVVDPRPPNSLSCVGGGNCTDLVSGTMNPANTLSYSLLLTVEYGHWSPALFYLGGSQWTYAPKDVKNPVDGTTVSGPEGFSPTSVRQTHYFSAWLDYNVNSWLTAEVGFMNQTSALTGSGKYANPFFNQYADTRVYLGASFQLDNLVKAIQGGGDGEAGVVRAKNRKTPMWTF